MNNNSGSTIHRKTLTASVAVYSSSKSTNTNGSVCGIHVPSGIKMRFTCSMNGTVQLTLHKESLDSYKQRLCNPQLARQSLAGTDHQVEYRNIQRDLVFVEY